LQYATLIERKGNIKKIVKWGGSRASFQFKSAATQRESRSRQEASKVWQQQPEENQTKRTARRESEEKDQEACACVEKKRREKLEGNTPRQKTEEEGTIDGERRRAPR